MARLYYVKRSNLRPLDQLEREALRESLKYLLETNLPHSYHKGLSGIKYYEDKGMDLENGVMGAHDYLHPNEIYLSPYLVKDLNYRSKSGILNNETIMNTIVHELTHAEQRRWLFGFAWLILNIPIVCEFTLEKWAKENGSYAEKWLCEKYSALRQDIS